MSRHVVALAGRRTLTVGWDPPLQQACRHGGPVRTRHPGEQAWEHWGRELALGAAVAICGGRRARLARGSPSLPATYAHAEVEASWRPVATYAAGVLCLRYAEGARACR